MSHYHRSPDDRGYEPRRSPPHDRYRGGRSPREPRYSERHKRSGCLFVGNIPYGFAERDIRDLFYRVGKIENVTIGINRATGQHKGHAFVQFAHHEDAQEAHFKFQGYIIQNRPLHLDWDAGFKTKMRSYPRPSYRSRRYTPYERRSRRRSPRSYSRSYSRSPSRSPVRRSRRSHRSRYDSRSLSRSPDSRSPRNSHSASPSPRARSPRDGDQSPRKGSRSPAPDKRASLSPKQRSPRNNDDTKRSPSPHSDSHRSPETGGD